MWLFNKGEECGFKEGYSKGYLDAHLKYIDMPLTFDEVADDAGLIYWQPEGVR